MIKMSELEKKVFRGIFIILLFLYSAYWQYIPITIFHLDVENLSNSMRVILSAFSSFITLFILYFIYRKDLKKEFKIFWKKPLENFNTSFECWIIGLLIMMGSNLIIIFLFKGNGANNEKLVQEMIKTLPWFMILEAGFIAPFNEEIVFRKTIKDILGNNKWLFVGASFLLFGFAHVIGNANTWTDYLYVIPYGSLGAAFALAYYKTDTIFAPMSMHMIHNLILTIISIIGL